MNRWKSLWAGPTLSDSVTRTEQYTTYYQTWESTGLYALDMEDRAWTYCLRFDGPKTTHRWFRVEDLTSGAAARQSTAEGE